MKSSLSSVLILLCMPSHSFAGRIFEFEGRIVPEAKSNCDGGRAELFLSDAESGTLIYQVDVIPNGTFEFKLRPGKYKVRAVDLAGCEGTYVLDATNGSGASQSLKISKQAEVKPEKKTEEKL